MMKYLPEIFQAAENAPDISTAIQILKTYAASNPVAAKTLQFFLESLYHPQVVMDLPPGKPPYRAASDLYGYAPSNLFKTMPAIVNFVQGHSKYIPNKMKREQFFIRLLETMHKQESELFLMCKEKKLEGFTKLNFNLFKFAFPQWLGALPGPAVPETAPAPVADQPVVSAESQPAPYGYKKDGTPRKRPESATAAAVAKAAANKKARREAAGAEAK